MNAPPMGAVPFIPELYRETVSIPRKRTSHNQSRRTWIAIPGGGTIKMALELSGSDNESVRPF